MKNIFLLVYGISSEDTSNKFGLLGEFQLTQQVKFFYSIKDLDLNLAYTKFN